MFEVGTFKEQTRAFGGLTTTMAYLESYNAMFLKPLSLDLCFILFIK